MQREHIFAEIYRVQKDIFTKISIPHHNENIIRRLIIFSLAL